MIKKLKWNKYAVTGAAGFIGSHIAEEILRQGKEVVMIDNFVSGNKDNLKFLQVLPNQWEDGGWAFCERDICSLDKMVECLEGVDVVFHLAASKCTVCRDDPHKDLLVNAMGSYNVFKAAEICGVKKVIHASTGSIASGKPKSFYGVSKLAGESYLRAFKEYNPDFNFTAIRYHHVYGPRQAFHGKGGVVPIFITKILDGEPITVFGNGEQVRHFTYVKDLVEFNLRCEDDYHGEYVNFANPVSTTINELIESLFQLIGKKTYVIHEKPRPGDIFKFDIKDNAGGNILGRWSHFSGCLKETIEYYREKLNERDRNQKANT